MTIIKNTAALDNYPFKVLPEDVRSLMVRSSSVITAGSFNYLMKIFEAYCDITNSKISYIGLSDQTFKKTCSSFLGSLSDDSLIEATSQVRRRYATNFIKLLKQMQKEVPLIPLFDVSPKSFSAFKNDWAVETQKLNSVAVHYWNGWRVVDPKGESSFLSIPNVWHSHGQSFAEAIFKQYRQNQEKKIRPDNTEFNYFLEYISSHPDKWPEKTFQCPLLIKKLFEAYITVSFKESLANDNDLEIKTKSYSKFINSIDESFFQTGKWAKPFKGQLPKPPVKSRCGSQAKIRENSDGEMVKNNLLTEIPLKITDSKAIEILFKDIRKDNDLVFRWATRKCLEIRRVQLRREKMASEGNLIKTRHPSAKSISDIGASNICASFANHGLAFFRYDYQKRFGDILKSEISDALGLPKSIDLIAFQLRLVHSHQCLTESFFKNFELYNKSGQLSGFLKTNGGYQLVGYKDRKGGGLSEQKVDLNPRDAALVRMLIEITEPLRQELKRAGDDAWRYLFLQCSQSINYPTRARTKKWGKHTPGPTMDALIEEFSRLTDLAPERLRKFINRVSVTTYRASRAVEGYLDNYSVQQMAKALGHEHYKPTLLASYLPQAILAFFQTRWIRIFQKGIICEAMKDSPRLLEAACFESMIDLDEFLRNHAIREIPTHLHSPELLKKAKNTKSKSADEADKVVVSICTGVLTALISLRDAVAKAEHPSRVSAHATYWARFGNLVIENIENGVDSDFQKSLSIALRNSNSESMKNFIYEVAA